jgi:hypothetical protein
LSPSSFLCPRHSIHSASCPLYLSLYATTCHKDRNFLRTPPFAGCIMLLSLACSLTWSCSKYWLCPCFAAGSPCRTHSCCVQTPRIYIVIRPWNTNDGRKQLQSCGG